MPRLLTSFIPSLFFIVFGVNNLIITRGGLVSRALGSRLAEDGGCGSQLTYQVLDLFGALVYRFSNPSTKSWIKSSAVGLPPSITATTELVLPKSIPNTLAIFLPPLKFNYWSTKVILIGFNPLI
jgi:hypothetical protein